VGFTDPQGVKNFVSGGPSTDKKNSRNSEWWTVWKYVRIKAIIL